MTPLAAAYDNIRLMRRKIRIVQDELSAASTRPARDAALVQLSDLTDDLVRAVQDFADAGFEEELAALIENRDSLSTRKLFTG